MAITDRESQQIREANASSRAPVVFVHGAWLLPSSWDPWRTMFREAGYATLAPGWPDDPMTVDEARADPSVFAGKSIQQIADHLDVVVRQLDRKPAIIGHSFGGLLTQILAGRGLAAASVAIDPAPFRGVLPLPISAIRSAWPALRNPFNYGRAVSLTYEQFRYSWANAVTGEEAHELFEKFHVAAPGKPLFQAAGANINPWTEVKVDTKNPDRGPLLILDGELDHVVPWSIANGSYKRQKRNSAITEIQLIPGRGHALTIDSGWREVAEIALAFVRRFLPG